MMTTETAPADAPRHPIRRYAAPVAAAPRDENDLKLFALSFTAFFIVIYSFIA